MPGYLVSDGLIGERVARFEFLWPEGCDETEVETERIDDILHFRVSDRSFSYSRLGLAYSRTGDVDL